MAASSTTKGITVKTAAILAVIKADPSLLADVNGVDTSVYDITVDGSYVLTTKSVQYKTFYAALNGPNHRIVYLDGTAAKAVKMEPLTVAYGADDGILCIVYGTTAKSTGNVDENDGMAATASSDASTATATVAESDSASTDETSTASDSSSTASASADSTETDKETTATDSDTSTAS